MFYKLFFSCFIMVTHFVVLVREGGQVGRSLGQFGQVLIIMVL